MRSLWNAIAVLAAVILSSSVAIAGTPTIVTAYSASPGVVDLVLTTTNTESGNGNATFDTIDTSTGSYAVDGNQPVAVSRWSIPYDEAPAVNGTFPVTVRHHIYLKMAAPFVDGSSHSVRSPYGTTAISYSDVATFCSAIQVNQIAYSAASTARNATFGAWLGSGGGVRMSPLPAYQVFDQTTGRSIFTGTASREFDNTNDAASSGTYVYPLPLNSIGVGGPYFVSVRGCGRSDPFWVGGAAERNAAQTISRSLYHQRCGMALDPAYTRWSRPICAQGHRMIADVRQAWNQDEITVPSGAPATLNSVGSWHDAGNFQKRPMHTFVPIMLMSYYEAFPSHFAYSWNIPESSNNIPDILDEALWGVLFWQNMQVTSSSDPQVGGVRQGMGETRTATYGPDYAANDPVVYGAWAVGEETTAYAAGIFAHASRLLKPFDAQRSGSLLDKARLSWAYLQRTGAVGKPTTYMLYASEQLYLATGDQTYHSVFKDAFLAIVGSTGSWPEQYLPGNFGMSGARAQTVHFVSYLLPQSVAVDSTLVAAGRSRITREADAFGYFQLDPANEGYPYAANKFYGWGASTTPRNDAPVFASLWASAAQKQKYINQVSQFNDFSMGLNPLGTSFFSGMGTHFVQSPLHLDSVFTSARGVGDVPGILIYGPGDYSGAGYQQAVWGKLYPPRDQLPIYRFWADGWSNVNQAEFTIFETLVWRVAMAGFLYDASAGSPIPPPVVDAGFPVVDVFIPPTVDVQMPPIDVTQIVCVTPPPVCGPVVH